MDIILKWFNLLPRTSRVLFSKLLLVGDMPYAWIDNNGVVCYCYSDNNYVDKLWQQMFDH